MCFFCVGRAERARVLLFSQHSHVSRIIGALAMLVYQHLDYYLPAGAIVFWHFVLFLGWFFHQFFGSQYFDWGIPSPRPLVGFGISYTAASA